MKIRSNDIINFISQIDPNTIVKGQVVEVYELASLFSPIDNGFYFFVGNVLPKGIKHSLVLTSNAGMECDPSNAIILSAKNSQELFYRMLDAFFKEKSDGVISEFAVVSKNAVIGKNVQIEPFCLIEDCIIGDNTVIKSHTVIKSRSVIGAHVFVDHQSTIGASGISWVWNEDQTEKVVQPQLGGVIVEDNCYLGAQTVIVKGSINENSLIGMGSLLAPGSRIGHGTKIGKYVHFANNVVTGGNTVIGEYSFVGSSAVFRPKVAVHSHTIVGAGSVVVKNTSGPGMTLMGVPAKESETKETPSGMPKPKVK